MRLILARLVHRYELTLVPGQLHERRYHTTASFVQGFFNVRVKQRKLVVRGGLLYDAGHQIPY
jgi:hypothetical protein